MSSSPQSEARMSEPLPCPECGAMQMAYTVESCQTEDGLKLRRLGHFKCGACGARFFDDAAMHRIQRERARHALSQAVLSGRSNQTPAAYPEGRTVAPSKESGVTS